MRGMAVKAAGGPAGPDAVARAWGYGSLREAALYCTVPDALAYFQRNYYGGGASA
jgi:hypothetical protein